LNRRNSISCIVQICRVVYAASQMTRMQTTKLFAVEF
ncbi:hypothetical protein T03_5403, partial [Trichinella britovi]